MEMWLYRRFWFLITILALIMEIEALSLYNDDPYEESISISCHFCHYIGEDFPDLTHCSNTNTKTCKGTKNNPPSCGTSLQEITGSSCNFVEGNHGDKYAYKADCVSPIWHESNDVNGSLSCREVSHLNPNFESRSCHTHEYCECYTDNCNNFTLDSRHEKPEESIMDDSNIGNWIGVALVGSIFVIGLILCICKYCIYDHIKGNGSVGTNNSNGGWVGGYGDGTGGRNRF